MKQSKKYEITMMWFDGKKWQSKIVGISKTLTKYHKLAKTGNAVSYRTI